MLSVVAVLFDVLVGVRWGVLDAIDGKIGLGGHGYAGVVADGTLLKVIQDVSLGKYCKFQWDKSYFILKNGKCLSSLKFF